MMRDLFIRETRYCEGPEFNAHRFGLSAHTTCCNISVMSTTSIRHYSYSHGFVFNTSMVPSDSRWQILTNSRQRLQILVADSLGRAQAHPCTPDSLGSTGSRDILHSSHTVCTVHSPRIRSWTCLRNMAHKLSRDLIGTLAFADMAHSLCSSPCIPQLHIEDTWHMVDKRRSSRILGHLVQHSRARKACSLHTCHSRCRSNQCTEHIADSWHTSPRMQLRSAGRPLPMSISSRKASLTLSSHFA